ncbi:MAG: thioredoxin [Lachnospiraceae bacterium]|nr:thioredoxin [Lachnospiraceae bacterium]
MGKVIGVTSENFEKVILQSDKKVLLDFWATWCGPCQMLAPIIEQFAEKHPEYAVGKINVDEEKELAIKYDIMSIPTLVVLDNGKEINRSSGVIPMDMILRLMNTEK